MQILNSPEIPADALTVPEAARRSDISRQALWERVNRGTIPTYHIAKRILVSLHDVSPAQFEKPDALLKLPSDAIPFADAAKLAGIHPSTVARAARHLTVWMVGTLRCISVAELEAHLNKES